MLGGTTAGTDVGTVTQATSATLTTLRPRIWRRSSFGEGQRLGWHLPQVDRPQRRMADDSSNSKTAFRILGKGMVWKSKMWRSGSHRDDRDAV